MGNYLSRTSEGRMRYTVKTGDTPAKIAGRILGDVRYAGLLVTINRIHAIHDDSVPGSPVQFMALTRIDLPSETEMEIYSRHYFTAWAEKKTWLQESASSVSSFLEKMREAAQRGAERISSHSHPVSAVVQAKTNFSTDSRTAFNGAPSRNFSKFKEANAATEVLSPQQLFDAFISGTR